MCGSYNEKVLTGAQWLSFAYAIQASAFSNGPREMLPFGSGAIEFSCRRGGLRAFMEGRGSNRFVVVINAAQRLQHITAFFGKVLHHFPQPAAFHG